MYLPRAFAEEDLPTLHQLIGETRLATLVTYGEHGLQANHLPLSFAPDQGPYGTLYGHLARANPQWQELANGAEALLIFQGVEAYVSPSLYPSKAEHGKVVPTWNYVSVHAYGVAEVFHDPQRIREVVSALTDQHEAGRASPWKFEDAPAEFMDSMLRAIVGFALPIQRLEGKRKLSQNRTAADIDGVREGLAASADLHDQSISQLMRQEQP
ncbi:Transcriptional regulator [Pseudomonas chlororaphis]|uniref:Transcriptional regulator n=1 Tax=Pseudomonas chlororaphis TaxID=587753 RepID=A0A3G7U0R2_9PSED|nr:FMN-binding negative transcriptional regulator [Pseudomonas chlororaphis]AZE52086.1 Transcriptional regulator [Pseudomonas chlororaphis]